VQECGNLAFESSIGVQGGRKYNL